MHVTLHGDQISRGPYFLDIGEPVTLPFTVSGVLPEVICDQISEFEITLEPEFLAESPALEISFRSEDGVIMEVLSWPSPPPSASPALSLWVSLQLRSSSLLAGLPSASL
jgi:hypothetical protein